MRDAFQDWLAPLFNDDGTGTTGTEVDKTFVEDLLDLLDTEITTAGGTIIANTTYYVETTGSDTTGNGSAVTPWATLTKALSVIRAYRIQPGIIVTIQIGDGVFSHTSAITSIPYGVTITGKNTYTKTLSSIQSSSGSAGAYSIVINVDNVANVTTADYAIIDGTTGGTTPFYAQGCFDITAVDAVNNRITIASTHQVGVPSGAVGGTVTILKTILSFTGVNGIYLDNPEYSVTLNKLAIVGNGTGGTSGIALSYGATAECTAAVGIVNFANGVALYSGKIWGILYISNHTYGIYARRAGIAYFTKGVISGCVTNGIIASAGATLELTGSGTTFVVTGVGGAGISLSDSSLTGNSSLIITGNGGTGISIQYAARASCPNITSTNNATYGIYAAKYGYIYANSYTGGGNGTADVSPSVNTQGNEYGYIDT
jgi:hypothetical protein